jgi:predicted amidohydrolase
VHRARRHAPVTAPPSFLAGLGQMLVQGGDPDANLRRAETMIADAAASGCRLVVLPECLDLGWGDPTALDRAAPIPGEFSDRIAAAARAGEIHVVAGLVERDGDRLRNTAVLYGSDAAILGRHRKVNELAVGRALYDVGASVSVVRTELATSVSNVGPSPAARGRDGSPSASRSPSDRAVRPAQSDPTAQMPWRS